MAIPKCYDIMLPLLKSISDGRTYSQHEVVEAMADYFNLTDEEREKRANNGVKHLFINFHWAKLDLRRAGLIESVSKREFRITESGLDLLKSKPEKLDYKDLLKYKEFQEFLSRSNIHKNDEEKTDKCESSDTPDEVMESSYNTINEALASELLDTIKNCSPDFFERLVVDLMLKMGYGGPQKAGRAIGRSGDGGVDGVINEDKLGLDVIYLQAKRYQNPVPVREVRDFAGSLLGKRSSKGIFITTSKFSNDTFDFIKNIDRKIILIDGQQLAQYMIEYNVGVSTYKTYEIKKIDSDYFEDI